MNPNIVDAGKKARFKPGQSGNPAGRPRRKPIKNGLAAIAELPLSPDVLKLMPPAIRVQLLPGATYGDALVISIFLEAITKGNVAAAREIREAIEGKTRYR